MLWKEDSKQQKLRMELGDEYDLESSGIHTLFLYITHEQRRQDNSASIFKLRILLYSFKRV